MVWGNLPGRRNTRPLYIVRSIMYVPVTLSRWLISSAARAPHQHAVPPLFLTPPRGRCGMPTLLPLGALIFRCRLVRLLALLVSSSLPWPLLASSGLSLWPLPGLRHNDIPSSETPTHRCGGTAVEGLRPLGSLRKLGKSTAVPSGYVPNDGGKRQNQVCPEAWYHRVSQCPNMHPLRKSILVRWQWRLPQNQY